MRLILNLTSRTNQLSDGADRFVFDQRGGSIGRAQDNDCVLPDPKLFVSRKHAVISYQGGTYYLTDTSDNGVFLNYSDQRVGKNNTVALRDGDCLDLGDYEFRVSIDQANHADSAGQREIDPESGGSRAAASPWGAPKTQESTPDILDGNAGQAKIPGLSGRDLRESSRKSAGQPAAESNHSPAERDNMIAPSMRAERPDTDWDRTDITPVQNKERLAPDWDKTEISSSSRREEQGPPDRGRGDDTDAGASSNKQPGPPSATGEVESGEHALEAAPHRPQEVGSESTPAGTPDRPTSDSPEPSTGGVDALQAFLHGAGLNTAQLSPEAGVALMELLGTLYREIVQGMMEVLRARFELQDELRMQHTQIRTKENNPLKFSVSADEALDHLVLKRRTGFLAPEAAFQEAFQDIKDHQSAMVFGMQQAFESLLQRFNPERMETRVKKRKSIANILPVTRKASCWDRYGEWYAEISEVSEDDFQKLFFSEFTRAYEEQVARLSLLRKKPHR
jgi:type VI secretion system protein